MKNKSGNYSKSIRSKLLNISKDREIFYQTILTRYFQERLLYRLSTTNYREMFYLKGGALMYAFEKFSARPTLDIDFLGCNINNDRQNVINVFQEICSVPCEEDGVHFDVEKIKAQDISELKDYHGIRISVPVSMDTITQVMTIDIGFGDIITPCPIIIDYPLIIDNLPIVNVIPNTLSMQIKWKAFIRKISSKTEIQFTEVARFLQSELKPYWENLNYE